MNFNVHVLPCYIWLRLYYLSVTNWYVRRIHLVNSITYVIGLITSHLEQKYSFKTEIRQSSLQDENMRVMFSDENMSYVLFHLNGS